jgi:hypothetical protein
MFKAEGGDREGHDSSESDDETNASPASPTAPKSWVQRAGTAVHKTAVAVAVPILESNYFVWRSIFGGACELQAVSWGGRMTILGFGLFVLFLLTVYQSALTTQMVATKVLANVENIDEGIRLGMRFCGQRVTAQQVQVLYPRATFTSDPVDGKLGLISRSDVFTSMDQGACDLGVVYEQDLEREHGGGRHCTKMIIGSPIMTSAEGMPFAPLKARAFSHWLQTAVNDGTWASIKQSIKPQSTCAVRQATTQGQVTTSDFLAQTTIVWTITLLGMLLSGVRGKRDRAVGAVTVAGSSNAAEAKNERDAKDEKAAEMVSDELIVERGWDEQSASRASMSAVLHGKSWVERHRASRMSRHSSGSEPESGALDVIPAPAPTEAWQADVTARGTALIDMGIAREAAEVDGVHEELSSMRKRLELASPVMHTKRRDDVAVKEAMDRGMGAGAGLPTMQRPLEGYVKRQRSKSGIESVESSSSVEGDVESPSVRGAPIVRRNQTTKQFMDDSRKAAEGDLNI